jgi:hypothetical protein
MSNTNEPSANALVRPVTSLRQDVHRHRQAVATGARAMQEWSASTADDDHALYSRLADIRQRLSTALQLSVRRKGEMIPARSRPRLRVVGSSAE